jgi:hypothetical protein
MRFRVVNDRSFDTTTNLWSAPAWRCSPKVQNSLSCDSVCCGSDPIIREWDTSTWRQFGDPCRGHFKNIRAISLNSSKLLISASHDNWSASGDSHRKLLPYSGTLGEANCITFSADDKHILSGGRVALLSLGTTSEHRLVCQS